MRKSVSFLVSAFALVFFLAPTAIAQELLDQQAIAKIKTESFQNSKVMDTLSYLTDVYGPRLSGSPGLKVASEWAVKRLAEWGIPNARLEPWGTLGRGWSVRKVSVEMVTPQYSPLIAYPKAWTPGTKGLVRGKPIVVNVRSKADFEQYRGKLKGAIVMNGKPSVTSLNFEADTKRMTDTELSKLSQDINPGGESYQQEEESWKKWLVEQDEITRFFHDEGIIALIEPSEHTNGVVDVTTQSYNINNPDVTFPALVMAREQYGRIMRILDKNLPVELEINVQTQFHEEDTTGYNVIAEIPGSDPKLRDEVVMLGGHFDSWHGATGATDNACSCAVMMEVMRILKASQLQPRRTIRLALWSGEELDYFGSLGYVKKHFGDPSTMKLLPEHEKLSAYFNLDNGAGKIRGIYLQGNEAVRPIFEAYLEPFRYLGATTLTTQNTGGTDHMPFDGLGLPGFQFIQDPLAYETRTHHTNLDVYEAVTEDDLKQSAAVIASIVYHTAQRPERLPRKPLPKLPATTP